MKSVDVEQTIQTLQDRLTQEKDWDAIAEQQLAAIKCDMGQTLEDAMVRAVYNMASEPVAWRIRCTDPLKDWVLMYLYPKVEEKFLNMEIQPLYIAPPQRPWIGLTDEDIAEAFYSKEAATGFGFARAIEAKLKDKNT